MMIKTIAELKRIFDAFNAEIFKGQLPDTMICVQSTASKRAYGFVTTQKLWKGENEETDQRYEMTIGAEYLKRTIYETAGTVLHECVHLDNLKKGIKDCSGKVHNKKFRDTALSIGMNCDKEDKIGWGRTSLNDKLKHLVDLMNIDESAFKWCRDVVAKDKPEPKEKFKYECPECGQKFDGKTEITAICANCNCDFKRVDAA